LIPYLSAEYTFRRYLAGSYEPIYGETQTFRFLHEILLYDSTRLHDDGLIDQITELTPLEVASMICLQGESEDYERKKPIRYLLQKETTRSTGYYIALFDGFVRFWNQASEYQVRRIILDSFSKLVETIIIANKDDDPKNYMIPLIEIEHKLQNDDLSMLITEEPDKAIDLEICDSSGYTLYYLDYHKVQEWLLQLSVKRGWLTPWVVRVIDEDNLSGIRDIINEAHDDQMIYEVLHYVTSGFISISKEWFDCLHRNTQRLDSGLLWNALAFGLLRSQDRFDDYRFSVLLEVISCRQVEDRRKLDLLHKLKKIRLPQHHVRGVWRSVEYGDIDSRYGIAIGISQESPNININDIFEAIRKSEGLGWLGLLLPEILDEKYDEEEVSNNFKELSFGVIQTLRRIGVAPWDKARLDNLLDLWWESNLRNVDDAINLLHTISKHEREEELVKIDYRETDALERIVRWLNTKRESTKKKFFHKFIESNFDMMDYLVINYLHPLYKSIEPRTDLDNLLVEHYPSPVRGLLRLPLSRNSWIKHIDKVDRETILEWIDYMEFYIEAGNVKTIDAAIGLLSEIMALGDYLIETFEPLSKWVLQRPNNEIAAFTLHILKKDPSESRMGYWQHVKESGLIEALVPISKNSPEVYNRILEIARKIPSLTIYIRSELQFLFEQLTPKDQLRVVRPSITRFLEDEPLFFKTSLAELILIHGMKKDVDILIHSLNEEPRSLGNIWLKNLERSKQISRKLTNPFSKLLFEIDMIGGWDEYIKELEKNPEKAEEDFLLFVNNDSILTCMSFLSSEGILRNVALKHWKRLFLSDRTSNEFREAYLGDLFQEDNDEIVEYVAGEIDRIHRDIKKEEEKEEKQHRTRWWSYQIRALTKIRDKFGYAGLRKLLPAIKDPYAIEGVMTYLVGAAKKEGIPKSDILSMEEFNNLPRSTKWNLLRDIEE
jgi:hypothetical protein